MSKGRKSSLEIQGIGIHEIQRDAFERNLTVREIAAKYNISLGQSYRAYMKAFQHSVETHRVLNIEFEQRTPTVTIDKFRYEDIKDEDDRFGFVPKRENELSHEMNMLYTQQVTNENQLRFIAARAEIEKTMKEMLDMYRLALYEKEQQFKTQSA